MTRSLLRRFAAPLTLGLALGLASAPAPVFAQEEAAAGEEGGSGFRADGYILMGLLSAFTLFVVAKSARR
ncbi:MAG: hypothetical protein U0835_04790 [Isosphaeraceae bacterium]